ncbi:hypothetical protein H310_07469 [Aphanomyces invadans]|uniref:UBX domain-containing protein 11 n=1 Tax=Aphanomyces invadans TaxID=157072 RepID=A0A024U353_9STRA|nr:hypothetical protein H310_07469 [Aphanomyces invadans]ETW00033.1 hypothetical protein H310_07469 [Aphanomyces invadans]|eukprot:XP_008871058.1 hypothetical protein H310_07469 [Aphanomyces invadans]
MSVRQRDPMYSTRTSVSKLVQSVKAESDKLAQFVDAEKHIADEILRDAPSIPTQPAAEPSLVTSLVQRLRVVEAQLRTQVAELQSKQEQVNELKDQLNRSVAPCGWCADHQDEAQHLKQQVADMTAFLNDHGLVWVGPPSNTLSPRLPPLDAASTTHAEVNYDLIIARVNQLNAAADTGFTVRRSWPRGPITLCDQDSLPLTLFKDGIMVLRGPFRPFHEPHATEFIQDILDGFSPLEFQDRYPDGVVFNMLDKRHEYFRAPVDASGQPLHDRPTKAVGLADVGNPLLRLPTDTFLIRLPVSTVRDGQVHAIRDEIAQLLRPPVDCRVVHIPGVGGAKLATLRVRTWKGAQSIQLHVPYTARLHLVKHQVATESRLAPDSFDLISNFPSKVYENGGQTVEEAGLIPSATLHIRMR